MRVMRHAYVRRPRTEGARVMRIACSQQASCVSPVPSTRSLLAIAASVVCAVRQMHQVSCTRATMLLSCTRATHTHKAALLYESTTAEACLSSTCSPCSTRSLFWARGRKCGPCVSCCNHVKAEESNAPVVGRQAHHVIAMTHSNDASSL
jgi:hypothetical protein